MSGGDWVICLLIAGLALFGIMFGSMAVENIRERLWRREKYRNLREMRQARKHHHIKCAEYARG